MSDIRQCTQCAAEDKPLMQLDLTGRLFCSMSCFQTFYKEHNVNNAAQSHDQLNIQQILSVTENDNAFLKSLDDKSQEEQLKIIQERISELVRLQQSLRLSEMNMKKRVMKIRDIQEGEKVERYRKAGCNSDLELKEKKVSKLGKMVASYKKMNMTPETIVGILTSISKFTREEILKEIEEL